MKHIRQSICYSICIVFSDAIPIRFYIILLSFLYNLPSSSRHFHSLDHLNIASVTCDNTQSHQTCVNYKKAPRMAYRLGDCEGVQGPPLALSPPRFSWPLLPRLLSHFAINMSTCKQIMVDGCEVTGVKKRNPARGSWTLWSFSVGLSDKVVQREGGKM